MRWCAVSAGVLAALRLIHAVPSGSSRDGCAISAILGNGVFVLGQDLTHAATGWIAVAHTNITIAQALPAKRLVAVETFASPWVNLFAAARCFALVEHGVAAVAVCATSAAKCGLLHEHLRHYQFVHLLQNYRVSIVNFERQWSCRVAWLGGAGSCVHHQCLYDP